MLFSPRDVSSHVSLIQVTAKVDELWQQQLVTTTQIVSHTCVKMGCVKRSPKLRCLVTWPTIQSQLKHTILKVGQNGLLKYLNTRRIWIRKIWRGYKIYIFFLIHFQIQVWVPVLMDLNKICVWVQIYDFLAQVLQYPMQSLCILLLFFQTVPLYVIYVHKCIKYII